MGPYIMVSNVDAQTTSFVFFFLSAQTRQGLHRLLLRWLWIRARLYWKRGGHEELVF